MVFVEIKDLQDLLDLEVKLARFLDLLDLPDPLDLWDLLVHLDLPDPLEV
jgi:hypothetical protein